MDIEANEEVEGDVGLEAGGVYAQQLEHLPLPLLCSVEEDGAVEDGEEGIEDAKDDQVVVDQLQHRAPIETQSSGCPREQYSSSFLSIKFKINPTHLQWLISVKKPVIRRDVSWYLCRYLICYKCILIPGPFKLCRYLIPGAFKQLNGFQNKTRF